MDDLDQKGFQISPIDKRKLVQIPWATYYHLDGTKARLPADRDSMRSYLARGFSLEPPVLPSDGHGVKCPRCSFIAKSDFGLSAHMRKHERESNKEKK